MAWYSFLTGVDIQKTIDTVSSGIDYAVYTDQEKKEMQAKFVDAKLTALSKQSIARRIIAVGITAEALLLLNLTVALHLMGYIDHALFVKAVLIEFMLQPFLAVVAFYFLVEFKKK